MNEMTVLDLISQLSTDTHITLKHESEEPFMDFWAYDYFQFKLTDKEDYLIKNLLVISFNIEDAKHIIVTVTN